MDLPARKVLVVLLALLEHLVPAGCVAHQALQVLGVRRGLLVLRAFLGTR